MTIKTKRMLWGTGILLGLLALVMMGVAMFFDLNSYKPQIEAAATKALGMRLKINGKAALTFSPSIGVSLKDVHLVNRRSEIFKANEVKVAVQIGPLIRRREWIIEKIFLIQPQVHLEKNAQGQMNYETAEMSPKKNRKPSQDNNQIHIKELSFEDADVTYLDQKSGQKIQVSQMNGELSDIVRDPAAKPNSPLFKAVNFRGHLKAKRVQINPFIGSDLKSAIEADRGILRLTSTELKLLGGVLRGTAHMNLRGAIPKIELAQTASQIDLSQISMKKGATLAGSANASVSLTAAGKDATALIKSARGSASLRSEETTITGLDIDALANQLTTVKTLDILKYGSALVMGSLLPTLGQAAGMVGNQSDKKSTIELVSEWTFANGVATTKDVAFSTQKNTIAFKGDVNLITKTYQNFYVATVDPQGCAKTKIGVVGALKKPRPSAASAKNQMGIGSVGSEIAELFGAKKAPKKEKSSSSSCEQFYSGEALRTG